MAGCLLWSCPQSPRPCSKWFKESGNIAALSSHNETLSDEDETEDPFLDIY